MQATVSIISLRCRKPLNARRFRPGRLDCSVWPEYSAGYIDILTDFTLNKNLRSSELAADYYWYLDLVQDDIYGRAQDNIFQSVATVATHYYEITIMSRGRR